MNREGRHQSEELSRDPLLGQLIALHHELRQEIGDRWNRSLSFADQVLDRWERARYLGFGEGSSVYDSCLVLGEVAVGEHTWVGPYTVLDGTGGLEIGSYCSISAGVQIYTHHTVAWSLSGGEASIQSASVRIGDRTYIGPQAVISQGVTVGSRAVVGATALVNRDVPDNAIVFGVPARVVGHTERTDDGIELVYREE